MKSHYIPAIVLTVLFCLAAGLVSSVMLPEVDLDAARYDLVIYSTERPEVTSALVPLFEEQYGIRVNVLRTGGADAAAGVPEDGTADLIMGLFPRETESCRDRLAGYRSFNEKYLKPFAAVHDKIFTPYAIEVSCMLVNRALTGRRTPVNTYGQASENTYCLIPDPAVSSDGFFCLVNSLADGKNPEQTRLIFSRLMRGIQTNPKLTARRIADLVARGEAAAGFSYESVGAELAAEGADIEIVYPQKSSICDFRTASIMRGAPHPENAKYFLDFLIGKDAQDVLGTLLTTRPVRREAKINACLCDIDSLRLCRLSENEWKAWADYIEEMRAEG